MHGFLLSGPTQNGVKSTGPPIALIVVGVVLLMTLAALLLLSIVTIK